MLWPRSFVKDCVEKGVPLTQLTVQYRMHEELYAAANTVVYQSKVASAYKTSQPSLFLSHLLNNLPEFTAGGKIYKLNSFANFINTLDQAISEMTADGSRLSTMSVLVYDYGNNVLWPLKLILCFCTPS